MRKFHLGCASAALLALIGGPSCSAEKPEAPGEQASQLVAKAGAYTLFETLQVRPLALSPDGELLFAANTPDNRLEIFEIRRDGLEHVSSVSVGLEPIAIAVRSSREVWVVNHLSDSISVMEILREGRRHPKYSARVVRTLLVGDEPRDIVFAGPGKTRAFVTTAHRGQNSPDDPELFTPAVGRADIWVFDANNLGSAPGGERLTKVTVFGDTPRALAVTPDGHRVYAAPFFSGNQTTIASVDAASVVYADRLDPENPNFITFLGQRQPLTSLIVKYKAGSDGASHWFDAEGTNFDDWIRANLPDYDVFAIDAMANPPAALPEGAYAHAGTTLFNMAVNPVNGKVYISNTEAHNDIRFEGHNPELPVTSVRGTAVDSRITVLDPSTGSMTYANLNPHVVDGAGNGRLSRAFPQDLTVSSDGKKLFVVAQGSGKLATYETSELEQGNATPTLANEVRLSAGGPSGVVLDERRGKAYVLTRFDNGISTVDIRSNNELTHYVMFNPEPAVVTRGRPFLYDATRSSANGTQACASCHIGGDFDGIAWDLGNPGGVPISLSLPAESEDVTFTFPPSTLVGGFPIIGPIFESSRSVKGPMTTQSLRGLANHGAMHWRGDRNGAIQQNGEPFTDPATGNPVVSAQPDTGIFDENAAFESFNVAFPGLLGRSAQLSPEDMAAFRAFALEITYPPNPIRSLDDSLTPLEEAGRAKYFQQDAEGNELPVDRLHNCNGCHRLDRDGNRGQTSHPGFFGSEGRFSFENLTQIFKVAHFRNAYQKVGLFASSPDKNRLSTNFPELNPPLPAVRGYGYQPDGATGSIEHQISGMVFLKIAWDTINEDGYTISKNPHGIPFFTFDETTHEVTGIDPEGFEVRRALAAYLLAYDSNLRPIVGQQLTITSANLADALPRAELMIARATVGDCDLVAKARIDGRDAGFFWKNGAFVRDERHGQPLSPRKLWRLLRHETKALTLTCVPPGSGQRIGIDRDSDGVLDGDDRNCRK
ncbi:MAG TPA: beta-propeller fold lactonase family protein [Polyangiaceae bacterium]|nr:beta-propeller fold lactonase family protein [Polyangiaceae bacterium]